MVEEYTVRRWVRRSVAGMEKNATYTRSSWKCTTRRWSTTATNVTPVFSCWCPTSSDPRLLVNADLIIRSSSRRWWEWSRWPRTRRRQRANVERRSWREGKRGNCSSYGTGTGCSFIIKSTTLILSSMKSLPRSHSLN